MLLSEIIDQLQKIRKEFGNVHVDVLVVRDDLAIKIKDHATFIVE